MNWWINWRVRHQHPVNLALHIIGIPLTLVAVGLAIVQLLEWRWDLWYRPVALLLAGYVLQGLGHVVEGNTMGEIILIRKWRGRPYVAVAARYREHHPAVAGSRATSTRHAESGESARK